MRRVSLFVWITFSLAFAACGPADVRQPVSVGAPAGNGAFPIGQLLADPGSLAALLEKADGAASDLIVIDARDRDSYLEQHIPGSVSVPWSDLVQDGYLFATARLSEQLSLAGVARAANLVVYDDGWDDGRAERLFWLLELLGCERVQVLEGGVPAWVGAGHATGSGEVKRPKAIFVAELRSDRMTTQEQVAEFIAAGSGGPQLVDAREDAAYLGWQRGLSQGGHLPGAVHWPASWLRSNEVLGDDAQPGWRPMRELEPELRRLSRSRKLVVYSDDGLESSKLYFGLRLLDFAQVSHYHRGIEDWLTREEPALTTVPGFRQLVSAAWLATVLEGGSVEHAPTGAVRILEAGTDRSDFDSGHIPGSSFVDLGALMAGARLASDDTLRQVLLGHGVSRASSVIVYGRNPAAAAQLVWTLRYAGVEDVRLLNGGWATWSARGGAVERNERAADAASDWGGELPGRPELKVGAVDVRAGAAGGDEHLIVDIRSWGEHTGQISHNGAARGRIQGARWGLAGSTAADLAAYLDCDGTLRNPLELSALWRERGISVDRRLTFSSTGIRRASLGWFVAGLLGGNRAGVHDGGWIAWTTGPERDSNPTATGIPD